MTLKLDLTLFEGVQSLKFYCNVFVLQVCEAKCIKCGKFGHMNTDKRCPLYGKAVDAEAPIQNIDQDRLIQEMRAEGLAMRWSAWDMNKGRGGDTGGVMQQMVEVERTKTGPGPAVDRAEVLKNMSKEEKKALLKKLEKMDKKKKKKAKKEKKKKSYSSDTDSEYEEDRRKRKEKKRRSRSISRDRKRNRSRSRSKDRTRDRDERRHRRDSSEEARERRRSRSRDRRDSRRS